MRLKEFDVLRAIAIFLVFGSHKQTIQIWMNSGWVGVDLFFVLSGFLVSGLLFSEYKKRGHVSAKRFLIRRGFKIYPPFYFLLLTTVVLVYVLAHNTIPGKVLASEALFVQNYGPAFWGHTWSLAVEEHFYLILAVALYLATRHSKQQTNPFSRLPVVMLVTALLLLTLRILTNLLIPFSLKTHAFPTHLRLDSLLFGVLISYYFHFTRSRFETQVRRHAILILIASAIFIIPVVLSPQQSFFVQTFGFSLLYLGFGGIVAVASIRAFPFGAGVRIALRPIGSFLAFIGVRSYSIYLWHLPVVLWGFLILHRYVGTFNYMLEFFVYVVLSVLLGIVMAKLIEWPSLWVRERLFPTESNSAMHQVARVPEMELLPAEGN